MKYADLIVPRGRENEIAISFIAENLITKMMKMGLRKKGSVLVVTEENESNSRESEERKKEE